MRDIMISYHLSGAIIIIARTMQCLEYRMRLLFQVVIDVDRIPSFDSLIRQQPSIHL